MKWRYIRTTLPTAPNTYSNGCEVYVCKDNDCDICPVKFQCFTESFKKDLVLHWLDWYKIRDKLEWYGHSGRIKSL